MIQHTAQNCTGCSILKIPPDPYDNPLSYCINKDLYKARIDDDYEERKKSQLYTTAW